MPTQFFCVNLHAFKNNLWMKMRKMNWAVLFAAFVSVIGFSSCLDNEEGEDAFCYLILSANTKEYTLTAKYSDSTESTILLKINARLVTAVAE